MPWRTPLPRFRGLSPSRSIPGEKEQVLALLDQADPVHPLSAHLRAYVESAEPSSDARTHFYFRFKEWILDVCRRVARHRRFAALFPLLFLLWAVAQGVALAFLAYDISGATIERLSWTDYAQAGSLSVTIVCVAIGIRFWPSGRARSYRWYIRAALVSIFITQVFAFFDSQLVAVVGLAVNVLIYASLTFMANLEAGDRTPRRVDNSSDVRTQQASMPRWSPRLGAPTDQSRAPSRGTRHPGSLGAW